VTGVHSHANEQRVLIVAPFGRDAPLVVQALQRAGFDACAVASVDQLIDGIRSGIGAVMIAGEALDHQSMKSLSACMAAQPAWSDIPIIVLTSDVMSQSNTHAAIPPFEEMGNVTLLPRPFSVRTVVGIVRFALRSRCRQYGTRELIRQLDEKTQDLTRSNSEFQSFAYTAAHDMREPIRVVESYLSLVSERFDTALGPTGMRYIGNAASAASRMRTLLQALLAYAHVGNSALVATQVSLKAVATAAIKNLSDAISRCSGTVMITSDDSTVHGDEALLTQLLQNLIGNGLKFQKPGAIPHIEVAWTVDGDQWTCSVRDNGIGIPSEARERVFSIFQRLHAIGEYPGSGIGLATCRRIVDRHGGRIWVESEVGVGSTFHVVIPIVVAHSSAPSVDLVI
jgi:signal transduction histidine kinase